MLFSTWKNQVNTSHCSQRADKNVSDLRVRERMKHMVCCANFQLQMVETFSLRRP